MSTRILLACAITLLTACGQKGPLYLPDKTGTVVTPPATTTGQPTAPEGNTSGTQSSTPQTDTPQTDTPKTDTPQTTNPPPKKSNPR